MFNRVPWLDRQLRFDLPVALFPNVVERVRGTPPRLAAKVQHLAPGLLKAHVDGRWSIQETIGHLAEVELIHARRVEEFLEGATRLTPVDLEAIHADVPRHNEIEIEESLATFRDRREGTVTLLDGVVAEVLERTAFHEGLAVHMRLIDHVWFMAEHDDHHLAGISEMLPTPPGQMTSWYTDLVKVKIF